MSTTFTLSTVGNHFVVVRTKFCSVDYKIQPRRGSLTSVNNVQPLWLTNLAKAWITNKCKHCSVWPLDTNPGMSECLLVLYSCLGYDMVGNIHIYGNINIDIVHECILLSMSVSMDEEKMFLMKRPLDDIFIKIFQISVAQAGVHILIYIYIYIVYLCIC